VYQTTDSPESPWDLLRPTSLPRFAVVRARYWWIYVPPNTCIVVASLATPDHVLQIGAVAIPL
jgi:hypothetical protein